MDKIFIRQNFVKHQALNDVPKHYQQPPFLLFPRKIFVYLMAAAGFLFLLDQIGLIAFEKFGTASRFVRILNGQFNLNEEFNIPTLFSFSLFGIASFMLFIISVQEKKRGSRGSYFWKFLGFLFIFLAFDEAIQIHEKFNKLTALLPKSLVGDMEYPWILPYSILALIVGILSINFLKKLPARTQKLFVFSGFLYCFAAVGFEIPESYVLHKYGEHFFFGILCSLEEFMEMGSIILFIYSLADYMAGNAMWITFKNRTGNLASGEGTLMEEKTKLQSIAP